MKKITVSLLLLALLLTGCTQTVIRCGVDAEKNAYLEVTVASNWEGVEPSQISDFKKGFRALADYYREKPGFAVEASYTDTSGTLTVTVTRAAGSYEEAFTELQDMLTDETITPFLQVATARESQGEVQGFGLDVTLDTGRILENLGIEDMPPELQSYFTQCVEDSTGELILELPASAVVSGPEGVTCEGGSAQAKTQVKLTDKTGLKLSTRAVIREGAVVTDAWETQNAKLREQERRTKIGGGVLALGVCLLIIALLTGRKKKRAVPVETEPGEIE